MTNKSYANDWAKSKSRAILRETIEDTLLRTRNPSQLYVLCFPGVDAAEVFEVYDQLRIPRANITGIERDPEIAREIERKNLGIRVVNGSLEEFTTSSKWLVHDIVSLDYTGTLNDDSLDVLVNLRKKHARPRFLFHQANLAKRDHNSNDLYLMGAGVEAPDEKTLLNRRVEVMDRFKEGDSIKEDRSNAYSGVLIGMMGSYVSTNDTMDLFKFISGAEYEAALQRVYTLAKEGGMVDGNSDPKRPDKYLAKWYLNNGKHATALLDEVMLEIVDRKFRGAMLARGYSGDAESSAKALLEKISRGIRVIKGENCFFPIRGNRYSYVSESGSPMMGDIYLFEKMQRTPPIAQAIAMTTGYPTRFNLSNFERINALVKQYYSASKKEQAEKLVGENLPERTFLGSSARPVLTKERAIEEFRSGATVDEVRDKYRGVKGKPLAQWKAHVTMGTYDREPREIRETIREDVEDADLEKITKEEVLDLLSSGIPPKEIYEAYPTSFTVGQLAAFKAWQTMRSR